MFDHLVKYKSYLNYCSTHNIHNEVTHKANKCSKPASQLPFPTLTDEHKEDLDLHAACVHIIRGLTFTLFEDEDMKDFCKGMNLAYKPPT